jgi:ABC-type multidrug transport system fused ATPase/permease subunit
MTLQWCSAETQSALRELAPFWRRHSRPFLLATALIVASKSLQIVIPLAGRAIMECDGGDVSGLLSHLAVACLTVGAYHLTSFYGHYVSYVSSNAMKASMLEAGAAAVMVVDYSEAIAVPPGQTANAITQASSALAGMTAGWITDLLGSIISAVGFAFMVCYISLPLTVGFLSIAVATQLFSRWYKAQHQANGDSATRLDGTAQSTLLAALQRAALVRLFPAARPMVAARMRKNVTEAAEARNNVDFIVHSNAGLTSGVTNMLFLCLLAGLASYKASGYATIGDIALFFVYIVQLQGHIQSAANEMNKVSIVLEQTVVFRTLLRDAAKRGGGGWMDRTGDDQQQPQLTFSLSHLDTHSEFAVVFDNVSAAYPAHPTSTPAEFKKEDDDAAAASADVTANDKTVGDSAAVSAQSVLEDVSFHIRKNTVTVIMGPSGGGKTTLVRLMAGLIRPTRGVVASSTADAERAGGAVAVLEQAPALLPGTVRANLLVAKPKATEEQLARACALASCTDFVAALPEGLDTCIENVDVTRFSGGQLQRLCLARVFLSDAPLVIFDEPTTGLDAAAAGTIMDGLTRLRDQGRTVVFVTHLEAHRSLADTLLVVREGRVSMEPV